MKEQTPKEVAEMTVLQWRAAYSPRLTEEQIAALVHQVTQAIIRARLK